MAAPVFVVSPEDFVACSHVLSQSLSAYFFWDSSWPLRLIQPTLKRKWRLNSDLCISPEKYGLYQLLFLDKSNMGWVLGHRPLSYDDLPVVVQRWATPSLDVAAHLRFIKFWIRLLDLPETIRSPSLLP
ncbi:hypothetical protein LINGRAHAP2_LOCUS11065 [Linum grandiflorum]